MNGMGVDEQSKHRLMRDLITMMVATFLPADDGNNSDDDDDDVEEKIAVAPILYDPIFQILEKKCCSINGRE